MQSRLLEILFEQKFKVVEWLFGKRNFIAIEFNSETHIGMDNLMFRLDKIGSISVHKSGNILGIKLPSDPDKCEDAVVSLCKCFETKAWSVSPTVDYINVLVKPTHACNLNCSYCYERPYRERYKSNMTFETVENIVRHVANYARNVQWIWHGGEATLVGLNWYKKVQEVFKRYPMLNVEQSMMSNGILMDEEMGLGLHELGIEFGVSYDGLAQCTTRTPGFKTDIVKDNLDRLQAHALHTGIINVITKETVDKMIELYEMYKLEGYAVSFNMVFGEGNGEINDLEEFKKSYKAFVKHWCYDVDGIHERNVSSNVKRILGAKGGCMCTFSQCHLDWVGINADGLVTPCDRVYPDKYHYLNINDIERFEDLYTSAGFKLLCHDVNERLAGPCNECGYLALCGGLCNATQTQSHGTAAGIDENNCAISKIMFEVTYEVLRGIDSNDTNINPHLKELLLDLGYVSWKNINELLDEKRLDFTIVPYTGGSLMESAEFNIFYGINSTVGEDLKWNGRHVLHIDHTRQFTPDAEGCESTSRKNNSDNINRLRALLDMKSVELKKLIGKE